MIEKHKQQTIQMKISKEQQIGGGHTTNDNIQLSNKINGINMQNVCYYTYTYIQYIQYNIYIVYDIYISLHF